MSRYTYKCKHGHHFETTRRIDSLSQMKCSGTYKGQPCKETTFTRVLRPPSIQFKGKGFYSTDNKK